MEVAERLREYLNDHDIQQKTLAGDLEMPPSTLNGYLTGQRQIPHDVLKKIADLYGITMDYFYGVTNDCDRPLRLSQMEKNVIQGFRTLTREQKELIAQNIRFMQQQNQR